MLIICVGQLPSSNEQNVMPLLPFSQPKNRSYFQAITKKTRTKQGKTNIIETAPNWYFLKNTITPIIAKMFLDTATTASPATQLTILSSRHYLTVIPRLSIKTKETEDNLTISVWGR